MSDRNLKSTLYILRKTMLMRLCPKTQNQTTSDIHQSQEQLIWQSENGKNGKPEYGKGKFKKK